MDSTHATHLLLVIASGFFMKQGQSQGKPLEAVGRTLRGGTGAAPSTALV